MSYSHYLIDSVGYTLRMGFPHGNLIRMLLTCEMAMNFVMMGKCIEVDSALLGLVLQTVTRHVY